MVTIGSLNTFRSLDLHAKHISGRFFRRVLNDPVRPPEPCPTSQSLNRLSTFSTQCFSTSSSHPGYFNSPSSLNPSVITTTPSGSPIFHTKGVFSSSPEGPSPLNVRYVPESFLSPSSSSQLQSLPTSSSNCLLIETAVSRAFSPTSPLIQRSFNETAPLTVLSTFGQIAHSPSHPAPTDAPPEAITMPIQPSGIIDSFFSSPTSTSVFVASYKDTHPRLRPSLLHGLAANHLPDISKSSNIPDCLASIDTHVETTNPANGTKQAWLCTVPPQISAGREIEITRFGKGYVVCIT
ncbi:unnamed protein product [Protopolystoma xenopodis]|uniref:Uncharacterized protein n=1 Tax=Protopolystoma xenopodis TaxID=117903 RepID=A0A448WMM4_9PLAT|nr:unnamed protein product [Protopolystoma xenopodis]